MPRNRVIYQTEVLYVGPSPSTGIQQVLVASDYSPLTRQLHRVQSINYGYSLSRRDVNQFGELAAIDRILLESPQVNLDFSYLNSTFYNELMMGFYINSGANGDSSCIKHILNKTQDDKNYYVRGSPEGIDAIKYSVDSAIPETEDSIFTSIGNGFISNFSTEGSVGDFPRTTVTIEGLNVLFEDSKNSVPEDPTFDDWTSNFSGSTVVSNPAVNPSDGSAIANSTNTQISRSIIPLATSSPFSGYVMDGGLGINEDFTYKDPYSISALKPGDITLSFYSAGTSNSLQELGVLISDAKIQSYNLNFALTRDPLQKLGSKYAFAREIRFPVQINLSVEANVGDIFTGNLVDAISTDNSYDVEIKIAHPQTGAFKVMRYLLRSAKLDSQAYTSSIGPNKSVTLNFSSQIGGPLQTDKGLFLSGYLPRLN